MKKIFYSIINFIKNNKIVRFIYNFIKFAICALLILYITFVVYQRVTGNAPLFGYRVFTVASGSMTPAYNINDVIYVKEVDTSTLKVGDDIAYNGERAGFEGLIITHRIIDIEETSDGGRRIFTQGIANENEDPSIDEEQIIGKVIGKVFLVSQLNHVVKSTFGFFFLIFLPLFLVIVLEIIETIIEDKIDKNMIRKRIKGKLELDEDEEDDDEYEYYDDDEEEESDRVVDTSLENDILEVFEEPSNERDDIDEDNEEII